MGFPHTPASQRRGTVLILVLGLITLFMALLLSITVRVYNSGKSIETLRRNAQAHIMMQAAKIYIAENNGVVAMPWSTLLQVTLADTLYAASSPTAFPTSSMPDRLGWVRIKNTMAGLNAGPYDILAVGGASAMGAVKTSANSGNVMANSFDVRYQYRLTYNSATHKFDTAPGVMLMPITLYGVTTFPGPW